MFFTFLGLVKPPLLVILLSIILRFRGAFANAFMGAFVHAFAGSYCDCFSWTLRRVFFERSCVHPSWILLFMLVFTMADFFLPFLWGHFWINARDSRHIQLARYTVVNEESDVQIKNKQLQRPEAKL